MSPRVCPARKPTPHQPVAPGAKDCGCQNDRRGEGENEAGEADDDCHLWKLESPQCREVRTTSHKWLTHERAYRAARNTPREKTRVRMSKHVADN